MKNNFYRYIKLKNLASMFVFTVMLQTIYTDASSQTEKGLWQVGGSAGFNRDEGGGRMSVTLSNGYFITNHLVAGGGLSFSFSKTDYSKYYGTGFSPYVSYYFGKGKLQPVLSIAAPISYSYFKAGDDYGGTNSSRWDTGFMTGGGVSYFLNDNAAIRGGLGYNFSGKNLYMTFGFQIYLGKRKE